MQKRLLILLALIMLFIFSSSQTFARTAFAPKHIFSTVLATPNPSTGVVTLTFDDGSKSQYEVAWPILQKYGFRGTFYVSTKSLDGYWYMTPQMIKNLQSAGNQIAAHTITHRDLTSLPANELEKELREPQQYLSKLIKAPVQDFASPFGTYNTQLLQEIKKYYRSHRSVKEGFNKKDLINTYELLVQNVYNTTSTDQVSQWVNTAKQNNTWLILVYHEVKDNPDQWSVTPKDFETQMKILKESNVKVVTLNQALK